MPTAKSTNRSYSSKLDVRPPRRSFLDSLSFSDRRLLDRLITEGMDCVYQEAFASPGTESVLFGSEASSSNQPARVLPTEQKIGTPVKTLSCTDERFLFDRYNYARYRLVTILKKYTGKALTVKASRDLLHWGRVAMALRAQIIQINMPLVLSMVKRSRLNGLDFNELVSEGNLALIRSVEKFDASRGFKFSTYACRAILKSFSRVAMKTSRYRGLFPMELTTELERSDFVERKRVKVEDDFIDDLKQILGRNLAHLNQVEQTVIHERFALGAASSDPRSKTLEQVGEMIGVTKERVRQIQNKALQKIKVCLEEQFAAA